MTVHADFLKYVDAHEAKFVQRLADAVQIKRYSYSRAFVNQVLIALYVCFYLQCQRRCGLS